MVLVFYLSKELSWMYFLYQYLKLTPLILLIKLKEIFWLSFEELFIWVKGKFLDWIRRHFNENQDQTEIENRK